jgi:hypothetical protein
MYLPDTRVIGRSLIVLAIAGSTALSAPAAAHEVGAPFSGAIIDPLVLHHAHIENEQRVNFFYFRGVETPRGRKRSVLDAELEIGWSDRKFKFGGELFLPVAVRPSLETDARVVGIGDLNLRPIKYAFVNKPDFIMTTATQLVVPTGNRRRGFGSGNTEFAQVLFVDKAVGNWFVGMNLEPHINLTGERESGLEYGVVLSYSFIKGTRKGELAAPLPKQAWVISPSIEYVAEQGFSGEGAGKHSTTFIPGVSFWNTRSGWQFRVGVALPASGEREADRAFLFQVGNHFNWGDLLGKKQRNSDH